jgi:hypothetical protein
MNYKLLIGKDEEGIGSGLFYARTTSQQFPGSAE